MHTTNPAIIYAICVITILVMLRIGRDIAKALDL